MNRFRFCLIAEVVPIAIHFLSAKADYFRIRFVEGRQIVGRNSNSPDNPDLADRVEGLPFAAAQPETGRCFLG